MIAGRQVRLVPLAAPHLAITRSWANDPEIMRLMDRARPVAAAEHEAWFAALPSRRDSAFFAIEDLTAGTHLGNVWLWAIDERHRKAELRVVVGAADARGRGIGAEAIDLLCRHGFERRSLHRIYAYVLALNPRARKAFENAGFIVEGTLREDRWSTDRFVDVHLLGRLAPGAA